MSAIKQALSKLDMSVSKLEGAIGGVEQKIAGAQQDMFAAQNAVMASSANSNDAAKTQALTNRLDSAIGKVEQILTESAA